MVEAEPPVVDEPVAAPEPVLFEEQPVVAVEPEPVVAPEAPVMESFVADNPVREPRVAWEPVVQQEPAEEAWFVADVQEPAAPEATDARPEDRHVVRARDRLVASPVTHTLDSSARGIRLERRRALLSFSSAVPRRSLRPRSLQAQRSAASRGRPRRLDAADPRFGRHHDRQNRSVKDARG